MMVMLNLNFLRALNSYGHGYNIEKKLPLSLNIIYYQKLIR